MSKDEFNKLNESIINDLKYIRIGLSLAGPEYTIRRLTALIEKDDYFVKNAIINPLEEAINEDKNAKIVAEAFTRLNELRLGRDKYISKYYHSDPASEQNNDEIRVNVAELTKELIIEDIAKLEQAC
jgi:hypothetical protein